MNIKMAACQAIARRIGEAIPELLETSKASWDDQEEIAVFPSVRVLPRRMEFVPFQEDEIDDEDAPDLANTMLAQVGEFEGDVEIRLHFDNRSQRSRLEDQVLDLFMETEGAVGTLPVETTPIVIKGRQTLYPAPVGCSLDTAEWQEELVFDKKRFSYITTIINFPALIARDATVIDSLRLAIQYDLTATVADEVKEIQEDGTMLPSSI